jgi:hypothetical protein
MPVTNGPNLHKMINALTGDNFASDFRTFLQMIDALVQAAVISKTLATPPGSPTNGDRYIVAASPTGVWTGWAGRIAVWTTDDPGFLSGHWQSYTPNAGWLVYNVADTTFYVYSGSAWAALAAGGSSTLAGDTDVLLTSPANNDVLTYETSSTKWKNKPPVTGVTAFTGLSDVPASYTSAGGKAVEVNTGATALVFSTKPFDVAVLAPGVGTNSQILLRVKLARAVTFPASATLSQATASAAATGSTTFTLKKNGSSFATVNYAASASSGTWTQASDSVFAAGDLLEIDGPATADATLADVGITLAGVRA